MKQLKYEDRTVLFLDYLGFRTIIENSATNPKELTRIGSAIDMLEDDLRQSKDVFPKQHVTQFSDSVVVSFRVKDRSAAFYALNDLTLAIIRQAGRKYLLRGGLTVGQLYHTKRRVMGPAMNKAYLIESKEAKYPRVVIDPKILNVARENPSPQHEPGEEARYVKSFLKRDTDGKFYIDYLTWDAVVGAGLEHENYPDYMSRIADTIKIYDTDDPSHKPKIDWLKAKYHKALQELSPQRGSEQWNRDPEFFECIESLPRFI